MRVVATSTLILLCLLAGCRTAEPGQAPSLANPEPLSAQPAVPHESYAQQAVVVACSVEVGDILYRPVAVTVRRAGTGSVDIQVARLRAIGTEPNPEAWNVPSFAFDPVTGDKLEIELPEDCASTIKATEAAALEEWQRFQDSQARIRRTALLAVDADFWDYELIRYRQWVVVVELELRSNPRRTLSVTLPLGRPMPFATETSSVRAKPGLDHPPAGLDAFGPLDAEGRPGLIRQRDALSGKHRHGN